MTSQQRYEVVKRASICHNCFQKNHKTIDCRRRTCFKFHKRHHTLLHFDQDKFAVQEAIATTSTTTLVSCQGESPSQVILGTAVVEIRDKEGKYRTCRAFLDSCSQCNAMTKKLASSLGLSKKPIDIKLRGVKNLQSKVQYTVSTQVRSRYDEVQFDLLFLIFLDISEPMPSLFIDRNSLNIPKDIFLADPSFHSPGEVDILIGAEHFYQLLRVGHIRVKGQTARFQETDLGWIFSGRYVSHQSSKVSGPRYQSQGQVSCNLIKFQDLPILWELGEDNPKNMRSTDEQAAETHFSNTISRNNSGRYVAKLPFNDKKGVLGDSRNLAFQRFYAVERKLSKNPDLKAQYCDCIQGYLDEKYISLIDSQDLSKPGYYLPHHAVIKEDSITTKTRVVFDGSAKTSTGVSLNDTLLVGPTIQEDLFSIVTRFRSFPYVLTADIQQMYRQIQVSHDDRLFQRILWRFNPEDPIKMYALNTVTFGTSCAPFLATRTLQQLADDEQESFPFASTILKRDFYVDDLLTGTQTLKEAHQLRKDLIHLLQRGGFNLRKWPSNHPDLSTENSDTESAQNFMSLDLSETVKTLGLFWDPTNDVILYTIKSENPDYFPSKRSILSQCAKLFDPLGLLGPVIVVGKILIQQLWKHQLSWDDPVPVFIQETWHEYKKQLPLLNSVKFKRCVVIEKAIQIQVHGFCDASEKAYGACLYLRSTDSQGRHYCNLLCSKSRVAPLKITSLPKLELCAAILLAKLYTSTIKSLPIQVSKNCFWSDSTITLNWINSPPHTLITFVANRVTEIQALTKSQEWCHVPTQDNPADFISRGKSPQLFLNNSLWTQGPQWLSQGEDTWPHLSFKEEDIPGKRSVQPIYLFKITLANGNLLTKYSSFKKLQRVIAYSSRFIKNIGVKDNQLKQTGPLSQEELVEALHAVIKLTQADAFSQEIYALSHKLEISKKSHLFQLNPFLDKGIIKVGGRLDRASIPETQKHPIVLPKGHHITKLIIRDEHINRFHAGVNTTLYGVRESYWPIDGKNTTRHIIRQCNKCFRAKPRESSYIMGQLPENRVSFERPFLHVGVDFCGPFFTKEFRRRNRTKIKTYVAVFVCFSTKAVHLELANDLTTEAFLACLKRFFATNFVGANRELNKMLQQLDSIFQSEQVRNYLSKKGIKWHFIPPRAPHFGGLWEAAVKSFKTHFTGIAGNSLLTYEQLLTYVVEIEAILNSRPLTPLSSDPNDLLPLTPAHFLIGSSMTSLPQEDLRSLKAGHLSCWQIAQQMRHHFWERWHREYLNEMISRSKWQSATDQSNIEVGTLVVMKEDNLPPMMWSIGRVIAKHPGEDGVVRVVTIRSSTGTYKRALKRVYPLPIN